MRVVMIGTIVVMVAACGPDDTAASASGDGDSSSSGGGSSGTSSQPSTTTVDPDTSSSTTITPADTSTVGPTDTSSSTGIEDDDSSTGDPAPACGDGNLDPDEGCDDGNTDDDDTCDSDCVPTDAIVWTREGIDGGDEHSCVFRTIATDAGVWIAGERGPLPDADGWLARIDVDGAFVWHHAYVGDDDDRDAATGLVVEADGSAIVAGYYTHNGEHPWIRRVDDLGGELWTDTWSDGIDGSESTRDLARVGDEVWLVAQRYDEPPVMLPFGLDGEPGSPVDLATEPGLMRMVVDLRGTDGDPWLFSTLRGEGLFDDHPSAVRLAADGTASASIDVATPTENTFSDDRVGGAVGPDGSLAIVSYDVPAGGETPTVRLYAADGTPTDAWLLEIDGDPEVNDLLIDDDGTLVLVGHRDDRPWARRVDAAGVGIWDRRYTPTGGDGELRTVTLAPDGDLIVAGCVEIGGSDQAWVRRYAP